MSDSMDSNGMSEPGPADMGVFEDAPVPTWIEDLPISEAAFVHAKG